MVMHLFFWEMSLFPIFFFNHFRFLFVWTIEYFVRSFLPNGVFLPCDHGLDFLHRLCENSIHFNSKGAPVTGTTLRFTGHVPADIP